MWIKTNKIMIDIEHFSAFRILHRVVWLLQGLQLGDWVNLYEAYNEDAAKAQLDLIAVDCVCECCRNIEPTECAEKDKCCCE